MVFDQHDAAVEGEGQAAAVGLTVFEIGGAGQAARDIKLIAKEILSLTAERKAA